MEEFRLDQITFEWAGNEYLVVNWDRIDIIEKNVCVYYILTKTGFYYYAVKFVSGSGIDDFNWRDCCVECLYRGVAYFDGVRHHYMGDEQTGNEGYDYYANLTWHLKTLEVIRELEHKHCREYDS